MRIVQIESDKEEHQTFLSIQAQDFIEDDVLHRWKRQTRDGFLSIQAQDFIEDAAYIPSVV